MGGSIKWYAYRSKAVQRILARMAKRSLNDARFTSSRLFTKKCKVWGRLWCSLMQKKVTDNVAVAQGRRVKFHDQAYQTYERVALWLERNVATWLAEFSRISQSLSDTQKETVWIKIKGDSAFITLNDHTKNWSSHWRLYIFRCDTTWDTCVRSKPGHVWSKLSIYRFHDGCKSSAHHITRVWVCSSE